MFRFSALLLFLVCALTQCTIEKRTFNNGYHISWNRSVKQTKNVPVTEELAVVSENKENAMAENPAEELRTAEVVGPILTDNPEVNQSIEEAPINFENVLPAPELTDTVYVYPKFEPVGVASAISGFAAIACVAGGIVISEVFFFIIFPLLLVALCLSLVSMTIYKKKQILYKSNVFAWIGLGIALLPILLAVILLTFI